jgi:hypothetical protein
MHTKPTPSPSALAALAEIELLADATRDQLAELALHTDLITVLPGTVLERSGSYPRQLLHVVCGTVRAVREDGSTMTFSDGSDIGAVELVDDAPHGATYLATRSTVLVVVFGPPVRHVLRQLGSVRPVRERQLVSAGADSFGIAS